MRSKFDNFSRNVDITIWVGATAIISLFAFVFYIGFVELNIKGEEDILVLDKTIENHYSHNGELGNTYIVYKVITNKGTFLLKKSIMLETYDPDFMFNNIEINKRYHIKYAGGKYDLPIITSYESRN